MTIKSWLIAPFFLCLALQGSPAQSQINSDLYESPFEKHRVDYGAAMDTSPYCIGSECDKDRDKTQKPSSPPEELENSFQKQGTKKGSVSSIVVDQLKPR